MIGDIERALAIARQFRADYPLISSIVVTYVPAILIAGHWTQAAEEYLQK